MNLIHLTKQRAEKLLFRFFSLFPIQSRKVLFICYYGSQYGCNPKYISEYLSSRECTVKFEVVWVFNDPSKRAFGRCRTVKNKSLRYFYDISTAHFVISNYRLTDFYYKRPRQKYIQTWHSSLRLKRIERDAETYLHPHYVEAAKRDSQKIDLLLSGCEKSTEIFKRSFWYDGSILECGTPRNDIFWNNEVGKIEKIKARFGFNQSNRILLYAPTFRNNGDISLYSLDYDALRISLRDRFGGDWVFFERFHPHLLNYMNVGVQHQKVRNVTDYDDIQELLFVADFLITDYSSLMFDFAVSKKPCILYTPDLERYITKERGLYFQMDELPFSIAVTMDELLERIKKFDSDTYIEKIVEFNKRTGSFEKGTASQQVVNYLIQQL